MDALEATIRREFLEEARELLGDLESCFIECEREAATPPVIDRIFRVMHTIKGSAMAAGFAQLGAFAHRVETLLSLIRARELEWTDVIADLLLRCNDRLAEFVAVLTKDWDAQVATADLEALLNEQIGEKSAKRDSGKRPPTVVVVKVGDNAETPAFGFFEDDPTPAAVDDRLSVLLCEDDEEIRRAFSDVITAIGLRCVCAGNGKEGLDLALVNDFDVILTDLRMPVLDGIEFIKRLRTERPAVPVVFLSGQARRDDVIQFMKLGAYDFLEKPVSPEHLCVVLTNAAHLKRVNDAVVRLSVVNFKAYIEATKVLYLTQKGDASGAAAHAAAMEAFLDEIASLTQMITAPRRVPQGA